MSHDTAFDFAIVGAGIAGVSLAARLGRHGSVLLLEREPQPGTQSSGRSAAMFMESYGPPQARALTRASRASYAAPSILPILSPRGVLYVAWAGQQAELDALAAGPGVERLDAAQALARVPVLRPEGLIGAVAEPDAMDIDVHAALQGWLAVARAHGAALWTGAELAAARRDAGAWRLLLTDGRTATATTLVDAAGAWADLVAAGAGLAPLGLQPRRRSAFTFDPPPGALYRGWPTVCAVDDGWYFKPDAGQLLGSPANADPVEPHDVVAEELDIAIGIDRIQERTTLVIRRPRHTWAGLRTFAPDGELVIGFDPAADGFFWLAGQGGYGIQSAAGAALLAESLILGAPLPEALAREGVLPAAMSPARLRA
ncbi:FAD-dependent oxidoreductase [Rubrivivax gelatinosus]|uniref:NAD(P)/FAD-dependent oxidoreductase n=1 Tax=Rubrivivax gelatinosus TaxID=28068 RepID=UPI00190566F4|nr:FAD-dependent oxidoreductase [Rubrivivax gelatinosus]MBK1614815.1 FAD-dependent oxidoreductase [Rubrivivax gelatinosus]